MKRQSVDRRRPKLQQNATQFPTLLQELARCVVERDNTSFMPPDFYEFLTALDTLDLPSSATSHFDDNVWATLVRLRRAKIESELKVCSQSEVDKLVHLDSIISS